MKVLLFGATGMIGMGTLLECLDDPRVTSVVSVSRNRTGLTHPKLTEVLHQDFFNYAGITERFRDRDACLFCLGVTSLGLNEEQYKRLTVDLTVAAAKAIHSVNPALVFCFVSGASTDSTGKGPVMWARVKGQAENALLAMGFKAAYMFRPGIIQPLRGIKSRTGWVQLFYTLFRPITPLLRRLFPSYVTNTTILGKAMIEAAARGYERPILESRDINRIGSPA